MCLQENSCFSGGLSSSCCILVPKVLLLVLGVCYSNIPHIPLLNTKFGCSYLLPPRKRGGVVWIWFISLKIHVEAEFLSAVLLGGGTAPLRTVWVMWNLLSRLNKSLWDISIWEVWLPSLSFACASLSFCFSLIREAAQSPHQQPAAMLLVISVFRTVSLRHPFALSITQPWVLCYNRRRCTKRLFLNLWLKKMDGLA